MPGGDHRVRGLDDEAFVRGALDTTVSATAYRGRTTLRFALSLARAAHAVPTGDMFRQLELTAWPEGDRERAVTRRLGRRFGPPSGGGPDAALVERRDERVLPGEPRVVHTVRGVGYTARIDD